MKAALMQSVTQVLNKLGGVQFDTGLPNKKVARTLSTMDTLLEYLGKTGKAISYLDPK